MKEESSLEMLLFQAMQLYEVQTLEPFLADPDWRVRRQAAMKIQLHGGAWGFNLAKRLRQSAKPVLRGMSMFLLGQMKGGNPPFVQQGLPLLIDTLENDPSPYVRNEATAALGHIDAPESIKALVKASTDPFDEVRASTAFALNNSALKNHPLVQKALKRLRRDRSKSVRYWSEDDSSVD